MPTLNWIGKDAVLNHHKQVPFRLLKGISMWDLNGEFEEQNDLVITHKRRTKITIEKHNGLRLIKAREPKIRSAKDFLEK